MIRSVLSGLKQIGGISLFILFLGFGCDTVSSMPDRALIFVDPKQSVYFAPVCVSMPDSVQALIAKAFTTAKTHDDSSGAIFRSSGLMPMPAAARTQLGLHPDTKCRDEGAFEEEGRSVSGNLLVKVGILPPKKSRWNADGSWNY